MNWSLQQLCEVGDSLPPPYPWQTEVNRVRPSVPSHTGSIQPNWSCCVSASITMSEPHLFLAKLLSSWYRVLHYQARKWSVHTDTVSWTHLSHLRRDGLSSGQAAVSINYRWSINRPSNSPTCLQDCCGGKRLKPDCAEVSVSDQQSYILQTIFYFLISSQISFRPFSKNKLLKRHFSLWTFICSSFSRVSILQKGHQDRHNKIPRLFPTLSPHFRQTWGSVLHHCCLFHCNGLVPMPFVNYLDWS